MHAVGSEDAAFVPHAGSASKASAKSGGGCARI
jgi:hypothetical protein